MRNATLSEIISDEDISHLEYESENSLESDHNPIMAKIV